jgi:serine-type D-Ala-D-Ala carboxypeptidase
MSTLRVTQLLRQAAASGVAPALAFAVSRGDQSAQHWFAGHRTDDPSSGAVGPDTPFDLASLTKPLTTTLWCLSLVDSGALDLESPLGEHLALSDARLRDAPVWRLLNHTAGLPAHRPYFEGLGRTALRTGAHASARAALRRMLLRSDAAYVPGDRELYSDLGYLLLEWVCEARDIPLSERWPTLPGHGPGALHMRSLPAPPAEEYAATERCPWRGRLLQGEVHDDNCWTLGGVGGHAGTFGTLASVHALARRCLAAARDESNALPFSSALFQRSIDPRWMHPLGTRVLGWDTPTPGASTSGTQFGRRAFGHLGFTGTSVWIDPDAAVVMTLLTNRVCPSRAEVRIRQLRPALHDAGWTALRG